MANNGIIYANTTAFTHFTLSATLFGKCRVNEQETAKILFD